MLVIKQLMVPIDFHSISFPIMEVNGDQQLFGSSKFFKYLLFFFNKETCTGLERHEVNVNDDKNVIFG